jgi:predicted outer membrane repeat protein
MRRLLSAGVGFALSAASASAATLTVGHGYTYSLIQQAINAASTGDTVLVYPGTYREFINFRGKQITVVSWGGPSSTIIDVLSLEVPPTPLTPAVSFNTNEGTTSVLRGFTIRGGSSTAQGGGIYCFKASPTIDGNLIISNGTNSAQGNGGGIFCDTSSAIITNNTIVSNYGNLGAGIYATKSSLSITNNVAISSNSAANDGGGIYATGGGSLTISGNTIESNFAGPMGSGIGNGGGIAIVGATSAAISGNMIRFNQAATGFSVSGSGGGGILCFSTGSATITINSNTIHGNLAPSADGGGIECITSSPHIYSNIIRSNYCDRYGGGICLDFGSTGAVDTNTIDGTNIALVSGGGIALRNGSNAPVTSNTITTNFATDEGAGIYVGKSSPLLTSNTITLNGHPSLTHPATHIGGGIAADAEGAGSFTVAPVISGNTIANNFADSFGGGVSLIDSNASVVSNTIDSNGMSTDPNPPNSPIQTPEGGGVFAGGSIGGGVTPTIDANLVIRNEANYPGGAGVALSMLDSATVFTNNIVVKNWVHTTSSTAPNHGAGVYCINLLSGCDFCNNTLANNFNADSETSPTVFGTDMALYSENPSAASTVTLVVWNCIIRGDSAHWPIDLGTLASVSVDHGDVGPFVTLQHWSSDPFTINAGPRFVNPTSDDYHLLFFSPCRDAGFDAAPPLPSHDFDGLARTSGTHVDIGADEY